MPFFKKPILVFYTLFSMVIISISFQNCSSPFEANDPTGRISGLSVAAGEKVTSNEAISLAIFEKTLYEELQQNCAICHGAAQQPLFATSNSLESHRFLFNNEYINLETPENSFISIKIHAGHNNFPTSLAVQLTESIAEWSSQLKEELAELEREQGLMLDLPLPDVSLPDMITGKDSPEQEDVITEMNETFTYIHEKILVPKCLSCHQPADAGGLGLKEDYTDYLSTVSGSTVVPGDYAKSTMYQVAQSGSKHPGLELLESEIASIKAWIEQGAKNN